MIFTLSKTSYDKKKFQLKSKILSDQLVHLHDSTVVLIFGQSTFKYIRTNHLFKNNQGYALVEDQNIKGQQQKQQHNNHNKHNFKCLYSKFTNHHILCSSVI